jgi:hypothetical protein
MRKMRKMRKKRRRSNLMEKSARVAKKPLEAKVNGAEEAKVDQIGGWQRLLLPKIKSLPVAEDRWKALTDAGLDPEEMAEYLYHYCGATKEQLKSGLKAARHFRDQFNSALVDEIRVFADKTERILKELHKIGGIRSLAPDFDMLPSMLSEFADEVESLIPILKNNVAQGVRVEKDGHITSSAGGEALSKLVHMVSRVTKHPYADLARLVAAVRGDETGYNYIAIADSLRNAFNRHWKENKGPRKI